jgi:hypothetical protein
MAQLLRSVMWRRIHQAGLDISLRRLLSQLEDIREVISNSRLGIFALKTRLF